MQALTANVADMALDYTKEELEAIALRLQCCAADAAHTAMGADMYLDEDKKTCEWNKYKYLKRVSGILREYIPGGIYSFRGPIEVENEIEVPLSDDYEFRSAVCVDDVLSPIFGYSFVMFTSVSTGRGYMYVIYDGQLHDIVDSNAYPIPYFRNTNSITHDHHNDFLVMGTNTEIQKADADQEASQPPSAPSIAGVFSSVGSDYKYSVYNPRNKYVYFSNTFANQLVKYKADTNSVTTINVPGAIGKLAVNTNSGQVIVIAGSTLQLVHPVTNVLTPLNLAVLLGAVTVDNVIYNTLTNRIVVQYNDGASNNIAILSSTGVVISPSIYSTFDIIGDILHYPTLDLYLVATSLQIEVVDANTLDVITVSELLHDKKNDKIIAISGKRLDLLLGTNDPAITTWNDNIVDENLLRAYSYYYVGSPSTYNLFGKTLYDDARKILDVTYKKRLPVYTNAETYTMQGGFNDFDTMVDIVSHATTTYETDFIFANPTAKSIDVTEALENSNYTGEAKNSDIFNVTMRTLYNPGQDDLVANANINAIYGSPCTVLGLYSVTLSNSVTGPVVYLFDPANTDITNIAPVSLITGIDPTEGEAISVGLIQGLTDGVNPTKGLGINRVEYTIFNSNPTNYNARLYLKMIDNAADYVANGSGFTYIIDDGFSTIPLFIPFTLNGSTELTNYAYGFSGSRFEIDNPVSPLDNPPLPAGELLNGFFYTLNDAQPAQWECIISNGNSGDVVKAININNVDYSLPAYTFGTGDDLGIYLSTLGLGDYETSWNPALREYTIKKTSNNPGVPPRFITWKRQVADNPNLRNAYFDWEQRVDIYPDSAAPSDPNLREAAFGKLFTIDNPGTDYHGHEIWFYVTPCPVNRSSPAIGSYKLRATVYYNGKKKQDIFGNYEDYSIYTFVANLGDEAGIPNFAGVQIEYDVNNNQFVVFIADDLSGSGVNATTSPVTGNLLLGTISATFFQLGNLIPTALPYPVIPGGWIQATKDSDPGPNPGLCDIKSCFYLSDVNVNDPGSPHYTFYNKVTGDVCFTLFSADSQCATANPSFIYHNIVRYNAGTGTFDVAYTRSSAYIPGTNDMTFTLSRKAYSYRTVVDYTYNRYAFVDFYDPADPDNTLYGVNPKGRQITFLDFSFNRVKKLELYPFLPTIDTVSPPTSYTQYDIIDLLFLNNEIYFLYLNYGNSLAVICKITNITTSPSIVTVRQISGLLPIFMVEGPILPNTSTTSSLFTGINYFASGALTSYDTVSWLQNGTLTPNYSLSSIDSPTYVRFNRVLNKTILAYNYPGITNFSTSEPNQFLNYFATGYHQAQWESDQDAPFNPLDVTEKKITILSSPSDDQPLCLNDSEVQTMIETAQEHCCDCCPDPLDAEEIFGEPAEQGSFEEEGGRYANQERFMLYYGNTGIDGAGKTDPTQISSLTSILRYQIDGTYNYYFVPDSYLYFAYPSSLYSPTIDFEDISTGTQVAFKAPYSISINGVMYTVHQSKATYNSPISIKVTV